MKLFVILLIVLGLPLSSWAYSGSRGGKLQSLRPVSGATLLPGRAVELVDETEADSKKHAFRIYLVGPNAESIDLREVESWSVEWRTSSKEGRLQDDLKNEKSLAEKDQDSPLPVYSFLATGELPRDPDLTLEVTISLPDKGGTGVATFSGVID